VEFNRRNLRLHGISTFLNYYLLEPEGGYIKALTRLVEHEPELLLFGHSGARPGNMEMYLKNLENIKKRIPAVAKVLPHENPNLGFDPNWIHFYPYTKRIEQGSEFETEVRVRNHLARMMNATQGRAVMHHSFERYEPMRGSIPHRKAGVMIATTTGQVTAYALDALYDRGVFFVEPGEQVYAGQVVGEHCRDSDIPVNAVKAKQMTNIRAASKDDAVQVRPARKMGLELAMEYIQADELVEICPNAVRIRKRFLKEEDRRRHARKISG